MTDLAPLAFPDSGVGRNPASSSEEGGASLNCSGGGLVDFDARSIIHIRSSGRPQIDRMGSAQLTAALIPTNMASCLRVECIQFVVRHTHSPNIRLSQLGTWQECPTFAPGTETMDLRAPASEYEYRIVWSFKCTRRKAKENITFMLVHLNNYEVQQNI